MKPHRGVSPTSNPPKSVRNFLPAAVYIFRFYFSLWIYTSLTGICSSRRILLPPRPQTAVRRLYSATLTIKRTSANSKSVVIPRICCTLAAYAVYCVADVFTSSPFYHVSWKRNFKRHA